MNFFSRIQKILNWNFKKEVKKLISNAKDALKCEIFFIGEHYGVEHYDTIQFTVSL